MKSKSIFLLGIIIISMFPQNSIQAEEKITRTFSSALDFLYLSDAILLNQVEDNETSSVSALMSPAFPSPALDSKTDLINQMINAAKNERNDHFKKCNETVNLYREQGQTCEADRAEAYCKVKYQQLTDKISALRILRGGDRRNFFTKTWHGIKRSGAKIWHRIGPLARKVLREVGPQALQIVSTGGVGSNAALRQLFKHTVKKIGREHLREIAFKGIKRMLKVQLAVATAAGIDICDPEQAITEGEKDTTAQENISEDTVLEYTLTTNEIDFLWHSLLEPEDDSQCGGLWPTDEDEFFKPIDFILTIDTQNEVITADIQGSRIIDNLVEESEGLFGSLQNQSFIARLEGPYQIDVIQEGVAIAFRGDTKLTLTLDGKRECHYWTTSGGLELNQYWINRNETINLDYSYEVLIHSYDGQTGGLRLYIRGESFGWNSGFHLYSEEIELSVEDIQFFLFDD